MTDETNMEGQVPLTPEEEAAKEAAKKAAEGQAPEGEEAAPLA